MPSTRSPGISIMVNDGGLVLANLVATTSSVLIIAPATASLDGDPQEVDPKAIASDIEFAAAFGAGSFLKTNAAATAWAQLANAGCRDIRVQNLIGATDPVRYANLHKIYRNLEDYNVDAVVVVGVFGNTAPTLVTEISDTFDYAALTADVVAVASETISVPEADKAKVTFDVAHQFIVDGSFQVKNGSTVYDPATYTLSVNKGTGQLVFDTAPGASLGAGQSITLTLSYSYYDLDLADRTFARQLASFCEEVSVTNRILLGFIAYSAANSTSLDDRNTYVSTLTAKQIVLSKYLSVVAGPKATFPWIDGTTYESSGVAAYAGLAMLVPAQSSPTNKVIPGALSLEYELSSEQLDAVCSANVVCFRRRNGRIVVTDGVTTASADSDYTRFTTSKIVKDVINSVRIVSDPYIGEPNSVTQRTSLHTAIDQSLLAMQTAGAIEAYRFSITSTTQQTVRGILQIDITIVPIFELRKIQINLTLKPSL